MKKGIVTIVIVIFLLVFSATIILVRNKDFFDFEKSEVLLSENPDLPLTNLTNVSYGTDPKQILDFYTVDPALTVHEDTFIVIVHGGGWSGGLRQTFNDHAAWFNSLGYPTANIDYRLVPDFTYPAQPDDILLALNFLEDNYGAEKFILFGHSAGAHLNMLVAIGKNNPHTWEVETTYPEGDAIAVIGSSGAYDYNLLSGPFQGAYMNFVNGPGGNEDEANVVDHVDAGDTMPILLLAGDEDSDIGLPNSIALDQDFQGLNLDSTLHIIAGDHNSIIKPFDSALPAVGYMEDFLSSLSDNVYCGNGAVEQGEQCESDSDCQIDEMCTITCNCLLNLSVKDIPYGTDNRQKLDVYYSGDFSNVPVVMVLHGGPGNKEGFSDYAPTLNWRGMVAVIINYRINGYTFPTPFNDAKCALSWTKENIANYGGDPSRIFVLGHSGGAHTGGMISYQSETSWIIPDCLTQNEEVIKPTGFIGSAGHYDFDFVNPSQVMSTLGPMMGSYYDPSCWNGDVYECTEWEFWEVDTYVDGNDPPALLIVGDSDGSNKDTDYTNSQYLSEVLDSFNIYNQLEIIPGGHGAPKQAFNNLQDPLQDDITQFFDYVLNETCSIDADCNDNVSCTADTCNFGTCYFSENHTACDNGLYCDGMELCSINQSGCIAGNPIPLDDNIICTDDYCDEDNDTVIHVANSTMCEIGFVCIPGDGCNNETPVYSSFDGETTDFANETNLTNVTNAVLEKTSFGKIDFTGQTLNFAGLNLDNYVTINDNYIEIDPNDPGMSNLDVSSRLSFYNIAFASPEIDRDGATCGDCSFVSYESDIYVNDVPGFSYYEIVETSSGDGGGDDSGGSNSDGGSDGDGNGGGNNEPIIVDPLTGESVCVESWSCSDWRTCIGGVQVRLCYDNNNCGTNDNKPVMEKSCLNKESRDDNTIITYIVIISILVLAVLVLVLWKVKKKN